MDVLDDLIAAGAPEWTVVLADEQTAGLGRAGRSWEAPPGSGLLCSVMVRPRIAPAQMGMLAIAAGVAIAEHLATLGVAVTLKWPNDVLLDGRKLAGILIRTRVDALGVVANVGIGLNVKAAAASIGSKATLDEVMPTPPGITDLMTGVIDRFARVVFGSDMSAIRDAWLSRAAFVGDGVTVGNGATAIVGVLRGIDEDGALLIRDEEGQIARVVGGDVVRGPRLGEASPPTYTLRYQAFDLAQRA